MKRYLLDTNICIFYQMVAVSENIKHLEHLPELELENWVDR